jgi:hypothetical protein
MNSKVPIRKVQPSRPRGFALVVTLSLMVLLTLLAVGLLGLAEQKIPMMLFSYYLRPEATMSRPSVSFSSILKALAVVAMLCATARAQATGDAKDKKSPILLRVLCKQSVPGATDLKIVQEKVALHDLNAASTAKSATK